MKKRILSVALALLLCMSSQSVAYAWNEGSLQQDNFIMGESVSVPIAHTDETDITPTKVYEAMISLKDTYPDGMTWTNEEPFSDTKGYYNWNGGPLDGYYIQAVGCVAFAFILSDAAFGSLPARMYESGQFTFEEIKVGDILRINNDTHTVIVLEVYENGVIIAEGNISTGDYIGKVLWGRAMSKDEVMKNTSHYITRYPEGYISPDNPEANKIIAQGTLDQDLSWNLTKAGTLTISGNGDMPDFSSAGEQPWNSYSSQLRKIVIEDGVTSIGSCAFWNCGVIGVEIPSSVTTIGNSAFRGSSIVSVTISSGVKTIGDSAFRECKNLSSVTFLEGVEIIEQNAFRACTSLISISLPASISKVGEAAFFECTSMTDATFASGNRQVTMGANMFTRCYYLMNVTLPKNVDCISDEMFMNCSLLAGVEIPYGAESIGNSAFASSAVSIVIIPDSVRSIGTASFSACPLTDIYFTGSETQWNSISKLGDTSSAVSKAAIHYDYTPNTSPDTDDSDDNNNNNGDDIGDITDDNTGDNSDGNTGDNSDDNTGDDSDDNSKPTEQKGDLNFDKKVDLKDAVIALRLAVGIDKLEPSLVYAADVDDSGKVDLNDAKIILKMAVGII